MGKDPWRVDEPLKPTAPQRVRGEKMNLGDDLDDDLLVARAYRFSCRGGSVKIEHVDASSRGEALHQLVSCLLEVHDAGSKDLFLLEYIAVGNAQRSVGMKGEPFTLMESSEEDPAQRVALYFVNHKLEDGMVRLIRLLKAAERRHPKVLEKWGIVPMSR